MVNKLNPDAVPQWLAMLWPRESSDPFVVAGINDDDCGVLQWKAPLLVLTTDYLNASPIAVELDIATSKDLGRLLVALSISDLLGSGAKPEAMLLGITLQHGSSQDQFEDLMKGAKEIADRCGVRVIGGDTKLGSCRALFSVGIGSANSRANLFLKNGAKPGDLLWCSGPLGSCNAGALGLQRSDFSDEWQNWAKDAILVPKLPLGKSSELSSHTLGRGGIDISDGLGADLSRLCSASGTGAVVDALSIPFEAPVAELANRMGVPPWTFAFAGGGDFQFLVSASKSNRKQVEELGLHLIGELTEQRDLKLSAGDRIIPLPIGGHEDVRGLSFSAEIITLIQQIQLD